MEASFEGNVEPAPSREDWVSYLLLGIALMVWGAVAIVLPLATAVAVNAFLGVMLLVGGALQVAYTIKRHRSVGRVVLGLIVSALYVIAGLILLAHPFAAIASLTLFVAAFFVAAGVFKIIGAIEMHGMPYWGWSLIGGILSFILGVLIWTHWPSSAIWAIGLLVGVDLLYTGWSVLAIGLALHMLPGAPTGRLAGEH